MDRHLTSQGSAAQEPAVLLINAASRSGRGVLEWARAELKAAAVPLLHEMEITRPDGLPRFVQAAIEGGARRIIVGGGDGSISCAADRILANGVDVALGVLPLGTGNDFARAIGMPLNLRQAIAALARARPMAIDVGRVNGRAFLNAASVGLTTAIARSLTPQIKRRFGPFAYALTAARCGMRQQAFVVRLERSEDEALEFGALQLVVGNGPFHGGGRRVSPEASLDDGLLDVYAILEGKRRLTATRALSLLRVGARMNRGRHVREKDVLQFRAPRITVSTTPPQQANVDGELMDAESLHFEVLPRAMRVLVP